VNASKVVNPESDCNLVVEKFKSGNEPPEDLPFEDLSNPTPDDQQSNNSNSSAVNHLHYSNSISGMISASKVGNEPFVTMFFGAIEFFRQRYCERDDGLRQIKEKSWNFWIFQFKQSMCNFLFCFFLTICIKHFIS
jgi:hypothetical protein